MTILDEIRSRGHVFFAIRPHIFIQDRVPLAELEPMLRRCIVQLRGWDLPHVDPHHPVRHKRDHIWQESSWDYHLEHWEFYRSGQLADLTSIRRDWSDISSFQTVPTNWTWGRELPITDTVMTLTEIFEFAARLALTEAGDSGMDVHISYRQMEGRRLVIDDPQRVPLWQEYRYDDTRIDLSRTLSREQLAAEAWDIAADVAIELFGYFGWSPAIQAIRSSQEELRGQARRATQLD